MARERGLEVGSCPERAVHDLRRKGCIGTTERATADLGVEGRRRPRVVVRDPVKHAGRDVSGGGYHSAKLTRVARAGTEIGGLANRVVP